MVAVGDDDYEVFVKNKSLFERTFNESEEEDPVLLKIPNKGII
jgi:hypothetical protein